MKKILSILPILLMFTILNAQDPFLPQVELRTIDGLPASSMDIIEPGTVTILVFWKSCNSMCRESLDAMHEIWMDSLKGKGVKMVAICVDGTGAWDHVKPLVNGNAWEFETYIDVNCDMKRAMNVNSLPCTILLDDIQGMICRHNGYCTGAEALLCKKIQTHQYAVAD